ncbi:hypothetical protein A167_00707 [Alcanivorax sp. S71-1-4]|uniref:hypothetical protein n=1 Tax=Alcanivorax sp. S71-1-4 TaxID=1177159 RepID=UPI00135B9A28|nr:hypothetical protein [Alcanivorax sp. S71-1-4]KAF0810427.1 hypothetical protein A167_00707 [Alcanivorax sp. S71-1-4]
MLTILGIAFITGVVLGLLIMLVLGIEALVMTVLHQRIWPEGNAPATFAARRTDAYAHLHRRLSAAVQRQKARDAKAWAKHCPTLTRAVQRTTRPDA